MSDPIHKAADNQKGCGCFALILFVVCAGGWLFFYEMRLLVRWLLGFLFYRNIPPFPLDDIRALSDV